MKAHDAAVPLNVLKNLPSVDTLVRTEAAFRLKDQSGARYITGLARRVVDSLRNELLQAVGESPKKSDDLLVEAEKRLILEFQAEQAAGVRRVINATGVVIHTNLGRAPLSEKARRAIGEAAGYATIEYDLTTGTRGSRGRRAETLVCEMTGAEAAIIVNNCAAAAFLVLTVFASGGEAIVSRGELVEIGGDFRVPDVLTQSGTRLREVGTTNRTRLADYEKAINESTRMILKVHPSNYRIIGFSAAAKIEDLAALAKGKDLLFYEDAGSGALIDLRPLGLSDEPVIADSITAGIDLITFSGDKLLGGPQAGIIAGKKDRIETIRKHPLYRVLRVDKLIYAALEATLESFRHEKALDEIPVLRKLSMTQEQLMKRAHMFVDRLEKMPDLAIEIIDGVSAVGGGAAPDLQLETALLALTHARLGPEKLEDTLRHYDPPVISRISDGKVVLDLRTVSENEEVELLRILTFLAAGDNKSL
jgi:L-seryl-tRNA(Ser) seleniumtransferase